MKATRAKFYCTEVTEHAPDAQTARFAPVINGSEENQSFSKYTPSGKLELYITNPDLVGAFKRGDEYYVDITPAK